MLPTSTSSGSAPPISTQDLLSSPDQEAASPFRELFEFAPVAYHEIDAKGILRRANHTECRMLGYTAAEMIGRPVWDFVAPTRSSSAVRPLNAG